MAAETRQTFRFRDYVLEPAEHSLIKGSGEIQLRPKSFEVLVHLVEHHGHLVTKGDLLDAVWPETHVTERTLTTCVWEIREALNDQGNEPRLIKTIPKVGYQFVGEVRREPSSGLVNTRKLWKPLVMVAVCLLLVFGWVAWNNAKTQPAQTASIAVLPFKNLSADPRNEYFSDGLTDAVIGKLSRIKDLKVTSSTSSRVFKGAEKSLKEIAKELDVAFLLEGSVQRQRDQVQFQVQLIDSATGELLWFKTYARELTDLFQVQADIAQRIASALKVHLSPYEKDKIIRSPTNDWTAYDFYLNGRGLVIRSGQRNLENSIKLFEKALQVDPQFALAYVGLAEACLNLDRLSEEPRETLDTSLVMVQNALAIDPDLPEAHQTMANLCMESRLFREALAAAERASQLDPNGIMGLGLLATSYLQLGELDKAIATWRKTLDLNPMEPVGYYKGIARAYWYMGEDGKAEKWVRRVLEIAPDNERATFILAAIHLSRGQLGEAESISWFPHQQGQIAELKGDYETAIERYREASMDAEVLIANAGRTDLARVLLNRGRSEEAENLLNEVVKQERELFAQRREDFEPPLRLARANAIQGNKDACFEWLENAIDVGWRGRFFWDAQIDPAWDGIRQEPRFQALMADVEAKLVTIRRRLRESEEEWE